MQTILLPRALPRNRIIENLAALLRNLPADRAYKLDLQEHKAKRTDPQNKYLWGVVYPAFTRMLEGWDKDDVHEYLLGECFGWERLDGLGRVKVKPIKRSSRLNKQEFAEYVDFCIRKGSEHGIYVPPPEND